MDRRIESILLENIGSLSKFEAKLGTLTILTGDNGTGKTTLLNALRAVFEGGHDPALLRKGTTKGRVLLTLSDGVTIERTITPEKSEYKIRTSDGSQVKKPAAYIETLAKGFSFDPLKFLEASPKERAAYLLAAMPITFEPEEMALAGGGRPAKPMDLEAFGAYREGIYERRREVNVQAKQLESSISALTDSLPVVEGTPQARAEQLRTKAAQLRADKSSKADVVMAEAETQRQIAGTEYQRQLADLKVAYNNRIAEINSEADRQCGEQLAEINAELETVMSELGTAEAQAKLSIQAEVTKKSIAGFEAQAQTLFKESADYTAKLEAIDKLKAKKLGECPIDGIEITNGKILIDGVDFDKVNTQRQYFIAFQLASLTGGELPLMIADNCEAIVGANWEEFCAAGADCGYQVVVARAEAGKALTVETAA